MSKKEHTASEKLAIIQEIANSWIGVKAAVRKVRYQQINHRKMASSLSSVRL
ncbi:hypothetical protein J2Z45_003764 [Cohnella lubricantis]|nr:hypothetical protein [Cohnella lubricantis]